MFGLHNRLIACPTLLSKFVTVKQLRLVEIAFVSDRWILWEKKFDVELSMKRSVHDSCSWTGFEHYRCWMEGDILLVIEEIKLRGISLLTFDWLSRMWVKSILPQKSQILLCAKIRKSTSGYLGEIFLVPEICCWMEKPYKSY